VERVGAERRDQSDDQHNDQLPAYPPTNDITIFGYAQGATVATQVKAKLEPV
jgi:hypothetical protein